MLQKGGIEVKVTFQLPCSKIFEFFGQLIQLPQEKATVEYSFLKYWHNLVDISSLEIREPVIGFLEVKRREFVLEQMERHLLSDEIFIPLTGIGIFPLSPANSDPSKDASEIRTFLVDGEVAFLLKKGTWHWAPYPLTDTMKFLIVVDKRTVDNDIHVMKLTSPLLLI